MEFKNLDDLAKYLTKQINNAMKTDVANESKELLKDHIITDVYDKYQNPHKMYHNTFHLLDAASVQDNGDGEVKLYMDDNIAQSYHMNDPNEQLEPYAQIVETGIGYDYDYPYGYNQPRPFMENTKQDLKDSKARKFLKDALKKRGIDAE